MGPRNRHLLFCAASFGLDCLVSKNFLQPGPLFCQMVANYDAVHQVLPSMKRKQWNVNVHAFAEFVNRKQINGRALLTSVGLDNLKGGFGIEDREAATNVMNVILELRQLSPGCMKIIREGMA